MLLIGLVAWNYAGLLQSGTMSRCLAHSFYIHSHSRFQKRLGFPFSLWLLLRLQMSQQASMVTVPGTMVEVAEASPVSAWSPPPDMADIFMSLVSLSCDAGRIQASRAHNCPLFAGGPLWIPAFALHRDPCLHVAFKKLTKDNKPL